MSAVDPSVVELSAHRGLGRIIVGEALVSPVSFSPRYDLDRTSGIFSRPGHPLVGWSIAGRVLVFPAVQGGVAAGWAFYDLKARGLAPLALLFGRTNPAMVQGAVLARITLLDGLSPDPIVTLRTGDVVEVDPQARRVTILRTAGDRRAVLLPLAKNHDHRLRDNDVPSQPNEGGKP